MNIITGDALNFKDIERNFFEFGCEIAKILMQKFLEKTDEELCHNRNKAEFRHKGKKNKTLKTLMGEVNFKRNVYKRIKQDGKIEHIYLLDEAIGLDAIGTISPNIAEKIAEQICDMSYRDVAVAITGCTNQSISHQGVWDIVQSIGEKQTKVEKNLVESFHRNELLGEKEVPILFEEADGLWLSMQGKSRKNQINGKKEIKVGIVYEGWKKRYPCSREYKTIDKKVIAGFMSSKKFKILRDAVIAKNYKVDEIQYRILNGDGATWIKHGINSDNEHFQLDPYHLAKCVVRNVYEKNERRNILNWLKTAEFDKAFQKIEELKYECGGLEKEVKKLMILERYIQNNIEGIVLYNKRKELTIPTPPEGIEYRNLGTMERNIGIFSDRMKKRKSWSENGATNLSKIIALKMVNGFKDNINALISGKLPEHITERFEEVVKHSKFLLKKTIKNSIYPMQKGTLPFTKCKSSEIGKEIRKMFNLKTFGEMLLNYK